ncbi:MAG: DUF6067 family protein [Acidobacteria bacterium]|nr:DUF6067 family protein [Acidobacteriota bacterium]
MTTMRTNNGMFRQLVLVGLATLLAAASARAAEPYAIRIVDPPLSNQAIRPDAPLPKICRTGNRLELMAARGEYEPASFMVDASKPLQQVHVVASDLRGPGGVIPAAAIDLRVVAPVFRYTSDFPIVMNWVLVHDPNLIEVRDEPQPRSQQPDAPPVSLAYTKTNYFTREPIDADVLQPADIAKQQQFWLTIHVPTDARPGLYHGQLTITAKNQTNQSLDVQLTVPKFDLANPEFEYSVYHPAWLVGDLPVDNQQGYAVLTADEYLVDLQNMAAHGCRNPVIYPQANAKADGTLDFSQLEIVLKAREQTGMSKDRLFLLGAGQVNSSQKLGEGQYALNVRQVKELVEYLNQRGYGDVHLMGADEATGEALMAQRDAWQSIHEGGARIFVAHYAGYTDGIGDLLNVPIMLHPMHALMDRHSLMPAAKFLAMPPEVREGLEVDLLFKPDVQDKIKRVHQAGHRVFTYMDPCAGHVWVEHHRRMRGLGLWKAQLDGTMTWAYTHINQPRYREAGPFNVSIGFVLRGKNASFDTLSWEAYREGYDDARYLATLKNALVQAKDQQSKAKLVKSTQQWMDQVGMNINLKDWRSEMARRAEELLAK